MEAPGFEALSLQHFSRTCVFLAGARGELEAELFQRERDLCSGALALIFNDTTSLSAGSRRRARP